MNGNVGCVDKNKCGISGKSLLGGISEFVIEGNKFFFLQFFIGKVG